MELELGVRGQYSVVSAQESVIVVSENIIERTAK